MLSLPDPALNRGNSLLSLDLFIKELDLAIEYQGEYHYFDLQAYGAQRKQSDTDEAKAFYCATAGIKLLEIPFWASLDDVRITLEVTA